MTQEEYAKALCEFVPEEVSSILTKWIFEYNIHLTISRDRKTKLGDFRINNRDNLLRISVNGGLNPYAFIITLVHEIAHAVVHIKYRYAKPHGIEWKKEYQKLMVEIFARNVFPKDINSALANYMRNPKASSNADKRLYMALRKYDDNKHNVTYLQDLEEGAEFILQNRLFRKGKKRRTRFNCIEIGSNREYTVNALAEVIIP